MKLLNTFLLAIFLLVSVPHAEASTENEELKLQIIAIREYLAQRLSPHTAPLPAPQMQEIIFDSAEWIVAAQEDSGRFGYEYEPFEDNYLKGDGTVRQAGTLFALSEVYKHQSEKDPLIAETIEDSIGYFVSLSEEAEEDDGDFWCIKNSKKSSRCDLGSVSLALIGILNYVMTDPEKAEDHDELIEKYVSYIKTAKFPGAGFSDKYYTYGEFSEKESPFYTGEAMLALVKYYQYTEDEEVKAMLEDTFQYLSAVDEYESPLYLWMMAALKDMHRLWPNQAYVEYARNFTAWRLGRSSLMHGITRNYCAPLEGFTSAYSVLENEVDPVFLAQVGAEVDFWLSKTVYLQLDKDKPYRLIFENGVPTLQKFSNSTLAHGGFLTGESELTQRIDFTQHCVSAYLQKLIDIDRGSL